MKRIALALSLLLIASAAAAGQPACARNKGGAFNDIACATDALKMAERDLESAYLRLMALLSPQETAALRAAQNAWLNFVAVNTRFVEGRKVAASTSRLDAANDREKLTRERIRELESWIPR